MSNYPNTQKLIETVTKYGTVNNGRTSKADDGTVYRYDHIICNYDITPNWLAELFAKAAGENGGQYKTQFIFGDYSFHFDRAKFKGAANGKITFKVLVEQAA